MSERWLFVTALGVAAGAVWAASVPMVMVLGVCALAVMIRHPASFVVGLTLVSAGLAARAEAGVGIVRDARQIDGIAELVADPARSEFGWNLEVRLEDGRRLWGRAPQGSGSTVSALRMGERVRLEGVAGPLDAASGWMRSRHLAGQLSIRHLEAYDGGTALWRSVNAVQRWTATGMESLDETQRALYLGVVFGDDRHQEPVQRYRFRASGIAHLLAVSGQNLALIVAVASPCATTSGGGTGT